MIYLGTFNKVAFPGLRLGWLAAPPSALEPLVALQRACHLSGVGFIQAAVARFCQRGGFEAYLRRIHRAYRRRMRALMDGLEAHMPSGVGWTRPRGGFTCWLTLEGATEGEAARAESVARCLADPPPPDRAGPKHHALSYLAKWYADQGANVFYEALWRDPAVAAELKRRLREAGTWAQVEALLAGA